MPFTRDGTYRKGYSASASSVATDATFNLSTGRLVVVALQTFFNFAQTWSVTDTAGNTYTPLTKYTDGDSVSSSQLFYCLSTSASSASNTWTGSFGETANEPTIEVLVYSYTGTAAFVAGSGTGGVSAAPASGAITAGQAAVSCLKHYSAETVTQGSGWTSQWSQVNGGPYIQDRIDDPGGTITPQCSLSGTAQWAIAGASFSVSSSASISPGSRLSLLGVG